MSAQIPEGLQYQSIESIVSMIKSLGMNVIRLTYAIEMVDDIFSNKNSTLSAALDNALGSVNGSIVLQQILSHNPSFTASTTRLEVYDAVTAECYKQQLLVHLDNHVSKGEWCCSTGDGNAWFGSEFFNVENWRRGNAFMANHAKSWPAYVSQGLRNELRDPNNTALNYGWESWYQNVIPTADAVNAANPDPLIFYSGLHFDTDLANVTAGIPLTPDGSAFDISDFCYADKIVFELHNYNNALADANCANFNLTKSGYNAMDISSTSTAKNFAPVVLTEFGFPQTPTNYTLPYAQCIKEYLTTALPGGPGGWIHWAVGGSYVSYPFLSFFPSFYFSYSNHSSTTALLDTDIDIDDMTTIVHPRRRPRQRRNVGAVESRLVRVEISGRGGKLFPAVCASYAG